MSSSNSAIKSNTKMPAKKTVAPASTPAPAPVAAAPAPAKTPRKAAAKAEVTVPVVDAAAPVVAADAAVAETRSASAILTDLQESLKTLGTEWSTRVRALVAEAGEAVKALRRDVRNSKRRVKKDPATMTPEERSAWEARRANKACLKIRPISVELASFMGL